MEDLMMMRNTPKSWNLLIVILAILAGSLNAAPVSADEAFQVAQAFSSFVSPAKTVQSVQKIDLSNQKGIDLSNLYAFKLGKSGFVIIANDDASIPVLGYSDKNDLPEVIENPNIAYWLNDYNLQLTEIRAEQLPNTETQTLWQEIKSEDFSRYESKAAVTPLLTTLWNQGSGWNGLCPTVSGGPSGRAYAGCVAVTMAQIMKFWNYPNTGTGANTYTPSGFPSQSVNFATQTYNWSTMNNNTYNNETMKLLYHAGVAVNMMYGATGSGAYSHLVDDALINYFRYANTASLVYRSSYTDTNWKTLLKAELNAGRPMYYAGSNATSGHAFVCDGYNSSDYFHFNWGWSGYADGYFAITNLNPAGRNYTNSQQAVIGIKPNSNLAPVATDDSYVVFAGNTITTTTTNGILKNDTDANGNILTAVKISDPAQGSLTLSANGSFSYTAPAQPGTYTFTYQAFDGSLNSSTATVTIKVNDIGSAMISMSSAKTAYYKDNIAASTSTNMGTWSGYSMYYKNLEGDSDLELLAYNPTTGMMYYKNNMKAASTYIGKWIGATIYIADVDGDSIDELLMRTSSGTLYYKTDMNSAWTNLGVWTGYTLYFNDINGDGSKDMIPYHPTTGKLYYRTNITSSPSNYVGAWAGASFYFADTDGDNAVEMLMRISNGTLYYKSDITAAWANLGAWAGYSFYFVDIDGDGSKDLIPYHPTTGKLYYRTNITSSPSNYVGAWAGASFYFADTDGDNVVEMLMRTSGGTLYYKSDITAAWANLGAWAGYSIYFKDLNGDGSKDLIVYHPTTGKLYYRTNITSSPSNYVGAWVGASLYFADVDDDNSDEILLRTSSGTLYYKNEITETSWTALGVYLNYTFTFGKFSTGSKGGEVYSEIVEEPLEKSLELKQNYPNPFNSTTIINFVTVQKTQVKLDVYNSKGEFVKNLYNNLSNAGENSVTFNATELSSGLYFYRIESEQKIETRKMTLTK